MERRREDSSIADGAETATPPVYLYGRIINRIRMEKKYRAARKRAAYFSFAFLASIIASLTTFFILEGALVQSEVFKLLSLIFSDPVTTAANWQDFGSFFLESLPVVYLAIFFASVFAFLESLRYAAKYMNETFSLSKLVKNI
jgi:hypothetical protein